MEVKFKKRIKGFTGAKKEVIDGQEVWVKIAPTKVAAGTPAFMPHRLKRVVRRRKDDE